MHREGRRTKRDAMVVSAAALAVVTSRWRRRVTALEAAADRVARRTCPDAPDMRGHPESAIAAAPSLLVRYVRWYVPIGCLVAGHTGLVAIIATIVSTALLLLLRRPLEAVDRAYARWWHARIDRPRRLATHMHRGSDRVSRWSARTMFAGAAAALCLGPLAVAFGAVATAPAAVLLLAAIALLVTAVAALVTFVSMAVMLAVPTLLGPTTPHDLLVDGAVLETLRPAKNTLAGRVFDFLVEMGKALRRL